MPKKIKTGNAGTDIIIAGGGIAGLTLAALLGRTGLNISLLEPSPPTPLAKTPATSRTVALMESSINILRAAGAWEKIERLSTPLKTMRLIDDSVANEKIIEAEFHANDIGMDRFGANVPNASLRAALYDIVRKLPSVKIFNAPLAACEVEDSGVRAVLEDGREIRAKLIVGADGRNSRVREIAGIKTRMKDYGQSAITCVIGHSKPHGFASSEFHRPSGPFALVPMQGNHSAVVWVEPNARADEILRLRKQDVLAILQKNSRGILGTLILESPPECWPLKSLQAQSLIAPRAALMAEAAHVMSPIAAQGLNLSLRDAAALAETVIDAARLGLDIGAENTLNKYRRRREFDVNARIFGVDAMNDLVSAHTGFVKGLRRRGLKTVDAIPPLRKFAMRQGLAPQMDLGRLAKGGAL